MHAGCQETYKHTVPPVAAMDVFKLEVEGETRKFRERINVSILSFMKFTKEWVRQ
jgi:hypothetical protein